MHADTRVPAMFLGICMDLSNLISLEIPRGSFQKFFLHEINGCYPEEWVSILLSARRLCIWGLHVELELDRSVEFVLQIHAC